MKLKLKFGNLIKEKSDFIVNASNTEFILGSGVSKSFRQHCGGSFFQQNLYKLKENYISKYGNIKQGDILVSNSGIAKNFKYSLHIAVMNYTDCNSTPFPTYKQLKQSLVKMLEVIKCISEQDNIKNPKLTIPLLGTGTGRLKKERVFLLLKNTILNSNIANLEIVIYFHSMKDYFKYLLKEKFKGK